jgi:hypothetical protein
MGESRSLDPDRKRANPDCSVGDGKVEIAAM